MMRIDAAIDALLPYGFSKETICSTVKKLLKVRSLFSVHFPIHSLISILKCITATVLGNC